MTAVLCLKMTENVIYCAFSATRPFLPVELASMAVSLNSSAVIGLDPCRYGVSLQIGDEQQHIVVWKMK